MSFRRRRPRDVDLEGGQPMLQTALAEDETGRRLMAEVPRRAAVAFQSGAPDDLPKTGIHAHGRRGGVTRIESTSHLAGYGWSAR